ncbi:MAG: DNA-directed RNA polymerase subunit alpha [Alphaproteobacteria bacterium]|nr:DNA-directed RNA polymerase subunit alpha [Alphaproteobacteria bacterium]
MSTITVIERNWQSLIKPNHLDIAPENDNKRVVSITAEPLERGFGQTLGNALRRVLLSSLQGAAVTAIQIDGVLHEFSSIPGVREDVTDIILNLKQLGVRLKSDTPRKIRLQAKGPGEVRAAQIETGADVEILDPDLVICTLDRDAKIEIELTVAHGKGYVPASQNRPEDAPIGLIPIDAIFSPVRRVAFKVENTRVGQITNYDKLTMTIETNGAVTAEDAAGIAARIIQDQLQLFVNFDDSGAARQHGGKLDLPFNPNMLRRVEELELSVRASNCLKNDNIVYIGDLVQKSEMDLLKTPNFGRKSMEEIKRVLITMGLNLGMQVQGWPPENIEELAKKLEEPY